MRERKLPAFTSLPNYLRILITTALLGLFLISAQADAQTYAVIHDFTGGSDGATPIAGVTIDAAGSLCGTASSGGRRGFGNVYRLAQVPSGWRFDLLYTFRGDREGDGSTPVARVVIGPDRALYGTTFSGGNGNGCPQRYGCGTAFRIAPKARASLDPWDETVLYRFGYHDGSDPGYGDLLFDGQGNLYGTTRNGGASLQGTVYRLSPSGELWREAVLYSFAGSPDGSAPLGGVLMDAAGNLFGTTFAGGPGNSGTIYELQPSGSGWTESVLYAFQDPSGGIDPGSNLALLPSGALVGVTQAGGAQNGGALFQLAPSLGGSWNFSALFDFNGPALDGTYRTLIPDGAGNFYGTTSDDGPDQQGSVFELSSSNGVWSYTTLHNFTGGTDGGMPFGTLALDAHGNVYGTASTGGAYGNGVVFKIAP